MRRSTRIRWQTPVLLTSLDPKIEFHERCETLVVNLHGCAVRACSTLPRGTPVQLQVNGKIIVGRVEDSRVDRRAQEPLDARRCTRLPG
jgi:hypothetical protein